MTEASSPLVERKLVRARTSRARIAGVVACVPSGVVDNTLEIGRVDGVEQVIKMTGVRQRHVVADGVTTSDLCARAAERLLAAAEVEAGAIDAIIFATQTPDFRLPATSCWLQDRLGLPAGIAAFDVNLGCSAYPYALWLAAMMIETHAAGRVLVLVGDTISRTVDPADRSTALLFGDCGTATLVEASGGSNRMDFVLGTDGSGWRNLIIPAGGFRTPVADTRNKNSEDRLFMEGGEIFNFTLRAVPRLVQQTFEAADAGQEDFDIFLFHQANAFMINHLAKKAKLDPTKVPINIDRFGNTSSATIPLLIATELAARVQAETSVRTAMFGFGVGYSWASCATELHSLRAAELVML